jgi:hypothetical protein
MANRQTYVVGALGVLLGMVVGANSAQRAEIVSYAGHNPNNEVIQNMPQLHRAAGIWRQRSEEEALNSIYSGGNYRITAPRRSSIEDNVQDRLDERLADTAIFNSAPVRTVRGARARVLQVVPGCSQYSRSRYAQCLEAFINGDEYQPNYFNTNY